MTSQKKIFDISTSLDEDTILWPGDPVFNKSEFASIEKGDEANVSQLVMGAHSGTHIDAPHHFLNNNITTDDISLDTLIGKCLVIEINSENSIEARDFENIDLTDFTRVLFKTKNSFSWQTENKEFNKNFISLEISAAKLLVVKGIKLIGIDYLSIESFYAEKGNPVHRLLLQNNIVILEGLNLCDIKEGQYELICLPLKIKEIEGSPARAILREI